MMTHVIDNPAVPILSASELPSTGYGEVVNLSPLMNEMVKGIGTGPRERLSVNDLYLPHFSLRKIDVNFSKDAIIYSAEGPDLNNVGIGLFFNGHFRMNCKGGRELSETGGGEQNFLFDPNAEAFTILRANTSLSAMLVVIDPAYFDSILPSEKWADDLRLKLANKELIYGNAKAPITLDQHNALKSVFENPMEGAMRTQMQEACLLQVLLHHLHLTFRQSSNDPVKINKLDRERLLAVREHLRKSFTSNHSLPALAVEFGINQTKLTTLFRQMFGVTIFDYLCDLKMEYARNLLQKEGLRVSEVAPMLRYKNAHHFSAAFKRKFGIRPSEAR